MEKDILNPTEAIQLYKYKVNEAIVFAGVNQIYSTPNSSKKVIDEDIYGLQGKVLSIKQNTKHPYQVYFSKIDLTGWTDEFCLEGVHLNLSKVDPKTIYLGIKYFGEEIPFTCIMTNSLSYKKDTHMKPIGIVWNSTGENKPYLKNYVQPSIEDKNYKQIIEKIGVNDRGNDYNHTLRNDGYHAWIGLDNNGEVISVQTLPWNMVACGCGTGADGSADRGYIQINICEGVLNNEAYFSKIYSELIHLTAYLCELLDINPEGTTLVNPFSDKQYPTIMDHQEAYKNGLATARTDVFHWFKRHDMNMRKARADISKLIYNTIDPLAELKQTKAISVDLTSENPVFAVKVNVNKLNVRKGPSLEDEVLYIATRDTFFVVEEHNGWGKIINEEGWINLQYTEKLDEEPLE